jgi:hypothetical protein
MRLIMRQLCVLIALAAGAAACSGSGPTGPSGPGAASITGAIVSPSTGSTRGGVRAAKTSASAHGLTVSVVGTELSAPVNGSAFELDGVPAGPLTLRFTGNGLDSSLPLTAVSSSEEIDLTVSVSGDTVELESDRRSLGNELQLEGRVESLPPTTLVDTLIVAGQLVTTTPDTRVFVRGQPGSFADLAIGVRVHVKGQADGDALAASSINIQNTNGELPVNVNGIITGLLVSGTDFEMTINGRLVKGDANTEFFGGSAFEDLADGARAEVKGLQQDGFVYARRIHVNGEDEEDEASNESASIEGILASISGTGDELTLVVGTTTVLTNGDTRVRRRGDVQELAVLREGMRLHVVGTRQADGSIVARMLQIKGDAAGQDVQIQGSMGGVKGSCAALQFSVNGFKVQTDGSTVFVPDCSATAYKSGTKVTVDGIAQADGSILATAVSK